MKNQPAVSIYIVTYLNSEERGQILKRTCEAALAQRYPEFEVVVSDNHSDFSVRTALESINDPRLKVCENEENAGFTGNMNRCLKHCSYNIIKPLCDDDLIHPDFLACTVPLMDDDLLVVADVEKYRIGQEPESLSVAVEAPPDNEVRESGYGLDMWDLPYSADCIPSATLFSRSLFERLGGYDSNTVISDWDFFIEVCLHGRVTHVAKTLCFVGVWAGSLTEEMEGSPFFFPLEGLYTKFRVYHHKALPPADRRALRRMLFCELVVQTLRALKQIGNKAYRTGFRDYRRRFFQLLHGKKINLARRGLATDL